MSKGFEKMCFKQTMYVKTSNPSACHIKRVRIVGFDSLKKQCGSKIETSNPIEESELRVREFAF